MPNKALSLALSTHPGPTVAVSAITVALGAGIGLDRYRLLLLGLAFLLGQASVGLSNDWLDAERDRNSGRQDKPVAVGWITPVYARNSALITAFLAVILTIPLGLWATAVHMIFIASAWGYNIGLKNTALSVLPYIVSFGLLPMIVTLARPHPAVAAGWAIGLGALLGVAAHFANVLPDLEDDERTGVRGLPHRLGSRASGIVCYLVLVAASVLALLGPNVPAALRWSGFAITTAIAITGIVLVLTRPPGRLLFYLIIAAALVNVAMLVISGGQILG